MPARDVNADLKAATDMMERGIDGIDIVKALSKGGYSDIAENVLNMLKQRISGDYLHTSAILDENFNTISAVNDVNDYNGPGTGYIMSEERWNEVKNIPNAVSPDSIN